MQITAATAKSVDRGVPGFRWLALATAVATYLLIVLGAFTRVSGSGMGCGNDWPLCHGQLLPPLEFESIVEWSHRFVASIISVLIAATALAAWRGYRQQAWILWPPTITIGLLVVQILLGMVTVKLDLPRSIVATHMANSLLILAAMACVATVAFVNGSDPQRPRPTRFEGQPPGFARLALWSAVLAYVVLVTGALVRASGAELACQDWPLCGPVQSAVDRFASEIHMGHRYANAALLVLFGWTVVAAFRSRRTMRATSGHTIGVFCLFVLQLAAGAMLISSGHTAFWRGVHVALATAVWAGFVTMALLAHLRSRTVTA